MTYLLIYISEVGACYVVPPKGTMEAFIHLSAEVSGSTLGNDIIKEVQLGMNLGKIPVFWQNCWVFKNFKIHVCLPL